MSGVIREISFVLFILSRHVPFSSVVSLGREECVTRRGGGE